MKALTSGKVAAAAGIGSEKLRFYEREGLIPAPPRTDSGYRLYPVETVDRIRFILRAKSLGFSLADIRELLSLQDGGGSKAEVHRLTRAHLEEVEARIRDLNRIRAVLAELESCCSRRGSARTCPIIRALSADDALLEASLS